ncbi:MAG: hypothetical protein HY540_03895 [Deltaproteobacteria bacterium]|nr:hypothetical protein [Deltaproteobacteria bacterium]
MLKRIPSEAHLASLYAELQKHGAPCVGESKPWPYRPKSLEELFCLAADMSRYDPRLMTILTRFLVEHWKNFNPEKIRSLFPMMTTPQTIAVMCEFILATPNIPDELRFFCEYLQHGLQPAPVQFYFHHLYAPGGSLAKRAAEASLAEYKRWGFLACEAPMIDGQTRATSGSLDIDSRRNILKNLFSEHKNIKISDYLDACQHRISRQQALLDLKGFGFAHMKGRGKGAVWTSNSTAAG